MRADPGPVTIGAREIYDQLVALVAKVDRLVDQLDNVRGDIDDHEQRLRGLERGRWPLPSLSLLVSIGSLVATAYMATR